MKKIIEKIISILSLVFIVIVTILLILSIINVAVFIAISTVWILIFIFSLFGSETITEVKIWKTSIKRDVAAAKEIREEIEKTANELKEVVKLSMENSFIIADASLLTWQGVQDNPALKRIEINFDKLSNIVYSKKEDRDLWMKNLVSEIYPEKKSKK